MDVSPYQAAKELGYPGHAIAGLPTRMYAIAKQCLANGGPHPDLPLIAFQVGGKVWFTRASFDEFKLTNRTVR
jgi:hypothetical protein